MRTDDGEEIVEPGDYDLGDDRTLRVYLTQDDDEQVHMWACTHCQEVDGMLNAILVNVIDGQMSLKQKESGEFFMSITPAGTDRVKGLIEDLADSDDGEADS
jgi:hypothetical protein